MTSVRHQHRHRHRAQDAARDAAQDELAQARMAVAAHHDEVGRGVGRVRQDRAHDVAVGRNDPPHLDLETMPGEMLADLKRAAKKIEEGDVPAVGADAAQVAAALPTMAEDMEGQSKTVMIIQTNSDVQNVMPLASVAP